MSEDLSPPLLRLEHVSRRYRTGRQIVPAIERVSLSVRAGETLGLVGESGSGKSTLARLIVGLEAPDEGQLYWQGQPISAERSGRLRRAMSLVFQDPTASLDPRMKVKDLVAEPLRLAGTSRKAAAPEVEARLSDVGLPTELQELRPHELSGGQRQRVALARALSTQPRLVVLDEPLAALDVSVGAQVANLLLDLQARFGLAYLLISHDLAMVGHLAHRIAVMRAGEIVENDLAPRVLAEPRHPYTKTLLACRPRPPR